MNKNILVIGATSEIGNEVNKLFALKGSRFVLIGRDSIKIEEHKNELLNLGSKDVEGLVDDLVLTENKEGLFNKALIFLNYKIDIVFINYASLENQDLLENRISEAVKNLNTNFVSAAEWSLITGNYFDKSDGKLIFLSSVAAERGRRSNYIYGASKSGMNILIEGLSNRFAYKNSFFVSLKLGVVKTKMSSDIEGLSKLLAIDPSTIAKKIYKIANLKKPKTFYLLPKIWIIIMFLIKLLPNKVLFNIK
tara:strand:+ start:844 stop:1593 length:750 start_codon:yes stop_codon:yes gene_type:complete